ncbi:MAG: glycosyltransferase N-terminal domain-containing protein, partial [Pseudomonadota bacterium]
MGRSLSLAAYRALTWRGARPADGSMPSRPKGELLWVHVTTQQRFVAVGDLCRRLLAQRSGLNVLFTCPSEASRAFWDKPSAMLTVAPADHLNAARAFLDHWKPNLCLWSGGELRPNVINQTANRNIPMILMDVGEVDLQVHRHRWLPDLTRTTLEFFDTILVNGEQTARQMQRSGVRSSKISVSAELRVSPNPTPWPEEELNQTTATLGGRPVWLAA